jgi:streptogramin lyase
VPLQEAGLDTYGEVTRIYAADERSLFVVDSINQLWQVDPQTGGYRNYLGLGMDYLADIALTGGDLVWWADYTSYFGFVNLSTDQVKIWNVDLLNPGGADKPNLGPVAFYNNFVWLASWNTGFDYGVYRFNPSTEQLCLYPFPDGGLFATDLAVHDGLLWALDWGRDRLFSMDPITGRLLAYDTDRDVRMFANLVSQDNLFWWAEDIDGGAVVRFDPSTNLMTVFNLTGGTYPRNLAVRGGVVWFTDKNGAFGRLDPATAVGTTATLAAQVLSEGITPQCTILGAPISFPLPPETGTFSWSNFDSMMTDTMQGIELYALPEGAEPFGIAGTANFVWVSDQGRQKLVRMPLDALTSITPGQGGQRRPGCTG